MSTIWQSQTQGLLSRKTLTWDRPCKSARVPLWRNLRVLSSRYRLSRCVKLQKDTYIRLTSELLPRFRCLGPGSWAKYMATVDRGSGWSSAPRRQSPCSTWPTSRQLAIESWAQRRLSTMIAISLFLSPTYSVLSQNDCYVMYAFVYIGRKEWKTVILAAEYVYRITKEYLAVELSYLKHNWWLEKEEKGWFLSNLDRCILIQELKIICIIHKKDLQTIQLNFRHNSTDLISTFSHFPSITFAEVYLFWFNKHGMSAYYVTGTILSILKILLRLMLIITL